MFTVIFVVHPKDGHLYEYLGLAKRMRDRREAPQYYPEVGGA